MTRRGLTLIELVLSLGILSLLASLCVSWMMASVDTSSARAGETRWLTAAGLTLDQIERDVQTGDWAPTRERRAVPKVGVEDGSLVIRTRSKGLRSTIRYRAEGGMLAREVPEGPARVLGDVTRFVPELNDDATLFVEVSSNSGESVSRWIRIPGGSPK